MGKALYRCFEYIEENGNFPFLVEDFFFVDLKSLYIFRWIELTFKIIICHSLDYV